jgi:glycosyltransferase involved in cell wall biosynthesis
VTALEAGQLRRVLIVARDFPPAGGAPAIRLSKLVRYLPEFGWEPVVITAPGDHAWHRDASLLEGLPRALEIHRVPRLLARAIHPGSGIDRRVVRPPRRKWLGKLLLPDSGILWAAPAGRVAGGLVDGVDAILTSAPPFSTHVVGLWVARRHRLPWVADYRDNWTTNPAIASSGLSRWLDVALERRVLREAGDVTVVSRAAANELTEVFGLDPHRVHVAMNGFDPDDLPPVQDRSASFEITYMGSLDLRRDPRPFLQALDQASRDRPALRDDVRIRLIGSIPEWVVEAAVRTVGAARVTVDGVVPHREALAKAGGSAVLLGITSEQESGGSAMTSKLLEYLGLRRPILMLAPPGPAVELLASINVGEAARPDDREAIRAALLRLHHNWTRGLERVAPLASLEPFTRRQSAAVVAGALAASVADRVRREPRPGTTG